jgi:hypothetical protein
MPLQNLNVERLTHFTTEILTHSWGRPSIDVLGTLDPPQQ